MPSTTQPETIILTYSSKITETLYYLSKAAEASYTPFLKAQRWHRNLSPSCHSTLTQSSGTQNLECST